MTEAARQVLQGMRAAAASLAGIGLVTAVLCGYPMVADHLVQHGPQIGDVVRGYDSVFDALNAMCWPGAGHDRAAIQSSFGWCEFSILDAMLSP